MPAGRIKSDNLVSANPLAEVGKYGQSIWFDYIRRSLILSGNLKRMVEEDRLRGVTSNPAIFEKAIAGSTDYKSVFDGIQTEKSRDPKRVYERIAIEDIRMAADVMKPVYVKTKRRDGYVSLEVSPELSGDAQKTCREARRLWKEVDRENLMIKVPATPEGIAAVQELIGEGINVNVTLIFSRKVYRQAAEAYIAGLEKLAARKNDLGGVASVASFFVSRIDSEAEKLIDEKLRGVKTPQEAQRLQALKGRVAIANAKLAYQIYKDIFGTDRWRTLEKKSAQTQRLLWASTGTKDPQYSDVLYVEELIGPDTVNTVPPATYDAFRDHGRPRASLEENFERARETMKTLSELGISFDQITDRLLTDGLAQFTNAFERLMCAIRAACSSSKELISRQTYTLPGTLSKKVEEVLADWKSGAKAGRLWAKDASLWTGADEGKWLDWLHIAGDQIANMDELRKIGKTVREEKFAHILLLGMGGSSLCPEVLKMTFGAVKDFPKLHVLDSTDPAQIKTVEQKVDLASTLFIVSSKSGSTLEPNIYKQYFYERVIKLVGVEKAGRQFIAITDPRSKLQEVAERDRFRRVYFGVPGIGGRFSALSNFGMVPAAAMGLDVAAFLERADEMAHACSGCVSAQDNPGLVLGAVLGACGMSGRDKITFLISPEIRDLGSWLEQLIAESTGKDGKGLIPVDRETPGEAASYGNDRLFVYIRLESSENGKLDAAADRLEKAGHPIVKIAVRDRYDLGQEFFRWEFATAVAGSILGIHAFNQPDVEASKEETRKLTLDYEKTGFLPAESPFFEEKEIKLFTDDRNAAALANGKRSLAGFLKAHFDRLREGDYFALLAYVEMNETHERILQEIRHAVRDRKRVATCLGFGPRFLHSTGQAYKGGPNTGVFLQITCDDPSDLPVPDRKYTFGVVKAAQARGDFQVLAQRGRRVLRVHLGKNVKAGLAEIAKIVQEENKR